MYGLWTVLIAFRPRYTTPINAMMEATVIATRRTLVALGAAPDPERKTHKIVNLKYRLV